MIRLIRTCHASVAGESGSNEDSCGVGSLNHGRKKYSLLAIADGLGGLPAGEVASSTAIGTLHEAVDLNIRLCRDLDPEDLEGLLRTGFEWANRAVIREGKRILQDQRMGTTLIAALLSETGEGAVAHIGDSRAYLIGETVTKLTRDHSEVQDLIDAGEFPPEFSREFLRTHPRKNRLNRMIGSEDVLPDIARFTLGTTRLLLCSDGLVEGLTDDEIRDIGANAPFGAVCRDLVAAARRKSNDDITVVVAEKKGAREDHHCPGYRPPLF